MAGGCLDWTWPYTTTSTCANAGTLPALQTSAWAQKDCAILVTHQPRWLIDWFSEEAACHNLRQLVRNHLRGRARVHLAGDLHFYMRHSFQAAPAPKPGEAEAGTAEPRQPSWSGSTISSRSSAEVSTSASSDRLLRDVRDIIAAGPAGKQDATLPLDPYANLHPYDPEHLIVNGLGGAFLHPTHVFAPARFVSVPEPPEDAAFLRGATPRRRSPSGRSPRGTSPRGGASPRGSSPVQERLTRRGSFIGDVGVGKLESSGARAVGGGGEFKCCAAYPPPAVSFELGRQLLHLFRHKNTRFDGVGAVIYFLLVVGVSPRCDGMAEILDAHTLWDGFVGFMRATGDAFVSIFAESYISPATLLCLLILTFSLARSGGVGALTSSSPAPSPVTPSFWESLSLRGRSGGLPTQLLCAVLHTGVHLMCALLLRTLLDLGLEVLIRYESVGAEGYHSLFRWYQAFEAEHFRDPYGLRGKAQRLEPAPLSRLPQVCDGSF
eukprot:jgi/Botrbrau1/604/Bobra.0161s0002.1